MNAQQTARHLRLLALAVALVGLVSCAGTPSTPVDGNVSSPVPEGPGPAIYDAVRPAVVVVEAGLRRGTAVHLGDGEYLTAAHVVRDALEIRLQLDPDADLEPATVVGVDHRADLALLRADEAAAALDIETASPAPKPGEEVWAVGHPTGNDWSIARGIVSHVGPSDLAGDAEDVTPPRVATLDLAVAPGSSGAPVVSWKDGTPRWHGIVTEAVEPSNSTMLAASTIRSRLGALRAGEHLGWTDAHGFIATVPRRSPLVHQTVIAAHVATGQAGETVLEGVHDTLVFPAFPAIHTIEVQTSWRYFFTGTHTFRYRVAKVTAEGDLEDIHAGPERKFELADELQSYVHRVEIDLELPGPGHYVVLVETHGQLTSVAPFVVTAAEGQEPPRPTTSPFTRTPFHQTVLAASRIDGSPLDSGRGDEVGPAEATSEGPIDIRGVFNLVRIDPSAPERPLRFDTWVRWVGLGPGTHAVRIELVDSLGQPIAEGRVIEIESTSVWQGHEHVGRWSVVFPGVGLYFVLVRVDGEITAGMPLWVE